VGVRRALRCGCESVCCSALQVSALAREDADEVRGGRIAGAGIHERGGLGFAAAPPARVLSGGVSSRAVSRHVAAPLVHLRAKNGGEDNVVEKYRQILADIDSDSTPVAAKKQPNFFSKMVESAKSVKTCETDYDCNPGGRNWPLRCVNVLFSKICIESDDDFGGGRGVHAEAVLEAIPVRVEDGYYGNGVSGGNSGQW
jgi:hypothetical protein